LFGGTPSIAGAGFALSVSDQLGFFLGAVAVGIADGAVEEVCALATAGKRPAFSPHRLAGSPVFQDRLGEARMDLLAARALLTEQAGLAWADAAAGREPAAPDRAARRATGSRVTALAKDAVDTAYGLAGGSAVYERSPLQRRLRDIHTATQHAVTGRDFYRALGAALVGEHTDYARR
jgi:alkylation response protein AidB-like acyl-CoA dehydrogenase